MWSVYMKSACQFFFVQVPQRSTKPESDSGAVSGGVVAVLIALVVVGVLCVLYLR